MNAGGRPFGDREINPKGKQTAHDYLNWMQRAPSVSVNSGAYLGNLEREEHVLGQISYPPDHPRYQHVAAGRYYPVGSQPPIERHHEAPSPTNELRSAAIQALGARARTNTREAACANCGKAVAPGEGRMMRRPEGYVVVHNTET